MTIIYIYIYILNNNNNNTRKYDSKYTNTTGK
jgi:hypothetical protein